MGNDNSLLKTIDKYGKDDKEKYIIGNGDAFLKVGRNSGPREIGLFILCLFQ